MTLGEWLAQQRAARMPGYAEANAEQEGGGWAGPLGTALGAGVGFLVGGPPGAVAGAKVGGSLGDLGRNAANHNLTPGNVAGDLFGAAAPFLPTPVPSVPITPGPGTVPELPDPFLDASGNLYPMEFALGGLVPDPWLVEVMRAAGAANEPTEQRAVGAGFVPLSADPAMRAAVGIQPEPQQGTGARLVDALAEALGSVNYGSLLGPNATGGQRTLAAVGTLGGRTFKNFREGLADERKGVREANAERLKMLNRADIEAVQQGRKKIGADAASEAKKRETWPVVPQAWAQAAQRPELSGQRVDPGTYNGLRETYNAWRAAQHAPAAKAATMTPDQRVRLDSNKRRFSTRVRQIESRIASLQKQQDDPPYDDDPRVAAKISQLSDALDSVHDQWDAADAKVMGSAQSPSGKTAVRPAKRRVIGPDGKPQMADADQTLPAGWRWAD